MNSVNVVTRLRGAGAFRTVRAFVPGKQSQRAEEPRGTSKQTVFRHSLEGFMTRLTILGVVLSFGLLVGCSGGAAGDPSDDLGDITVISTSPGNGDQLDLEDSNGGFNALDRDDLVTPEAITIVFSNSLDPNSVINPDPTDPQGTRNVRLFFFDLEQGPFDPDAPTVPGVNPPGANVLIESTAFLTQTGDRPNNTLIIRPEGFTANNPMPEGQYSVIVSQGVRGADGDGLFGQEYFFSFRVGQDVLGPSIVKTSPSNNEQDVSPDTEIRVTLSETALSSTVTTNAVQVSYTPSGQTIPIQIPGEWFTDGGNGPGNNFPNLRHGGGYNERFTARPECYSSAPQVLIVIPRGSFV
ncbi:MAG: Ig-like domain-containing protein, partial [Planctomycetota bacterium]